MFLRELTRPLLLDNVASIQQSAALALGRLCGELPPPKGGSEEGCPIMKSLDGDL